MREILHRHEIPSVITGIINEMHEIQQKMNHDYASSVSSVGRNPNEKGKKLNIVSSLDSRPQNVSLVDGRIFGRRVEANDIKELLLSDKNYEEKVPVVSIVGTGGIGKTTLAQLIYNDENVVKHFDARAWVCVSQDSDVTKITTSILESISNGQPPLERLEPLQQELKKWLQGKKFLLVLDDIWSDDRRTWDAVRVPINVAAEKGSRIIVTTRINRVSSIMSSIKKIDLETLPDEHCWKLFKRKAFVDDKICDKHPSLKEIGQEIVKKCRGMPLAVKSIGGLLYDDLDAKRWKSVLESKMWEVEAEETTMSALRLSYYYLPAHLKLCFAYCSLFPKDHEFDKETLVQLWIAEGFVSSKRINILEEDLGGEYFDDLFNRSFFQKYSKSVNRFVIHDLMHDLAESVSAGMYFRMEEGKSHHNNSGNLKMVHYVSMFHFQPDQYAMEKELCKFKELSTLLLILPSTRDGHILGDLFEQNRCLRVLDLSENYELVNLPNSIGNLKHLRLLNLNRTGIKVLPESLCNLYHLQVLMLENCRRLIEFPIHMGNLINLQYIVMGDDRWYVFKPIRGIGRLHFLRTLSKFEVIMQKSNGNKSTIGELKELRHLQGCIRIRGLEKVADFEEAKEANLFDKHRIDRLELEWNDKNERGSMEGVVEGLKPHMGLKELQIVNYGGISFPKWMMMMIACYDMLTTIQLRNCNKCKLLPPFGNLPSLKVLHISEMKEVEHIGKEFYGYGDNNNKKLGFPKLEIFSLSCMSGLKEWWGEEGEFPCLENLRIYDCPKLIKLPPLFPTVKLVEIKECDMVTSFPRLLRKVTNCPMLQSLSELHGLASLETLIINDCPMLQSLPELQGLASLEDLEITNCLMLQSLPELQG
ncbi:PREDICTED: putative disease resistance RPP13-like protein 1 [Nelumbo nucifera]|uniref:Disease resistance RPP13-like protein 1 n=1 Tax=Nelumbo nucifera TaxID=4432 RepID=A0A1U8Q876_NELNU|nr:PREDICTED: putative disease resistance RPP13-like protein 1 [Nelumbo nucifera]